MKEAKDERCKMFFIEYIFYVLDYFFNIVNYNM